MTAFVDTNTLVRHLTGDPPDQAEKASRFLTEADELLLPDLVVAELIYVLESFYEVARPQVAALTRAVVLSHPIIIADRALLLRALEVYELDGLDFAEAYLVAAAEITGVNAVASFDRRIDRIRSVRRIEPA